MNATIRRRFLALAAAFVAATISVTLMAKGAATYRNPVFDHDFPDPAVLQAPDGSYHVYATQGGEAGQMANIQHARSNDLVHWTDLGDAMPVKPNWASRTQDFWAPHVLRDGARYYLYFSAKPDAALDDPKRGLCLGVAVADRPEGPFVDRGTPLQCGEGFVNIDPMAFDDPATGKRLLYWGSGFGAIRVRELAADRISFAAGSRSIDLIAPTSGRKNPRDYQRLIEGAWVLRRGGWYYLFFSGDNCCGPDAHYAVLVARSRSATGPFEVRRDSSNGLAQPVVAAGGGWIAPGHNAVIADARGTVWLLYHAVDRAHPRVGPTDAANARRVMVLDRLGFRQGWPVVAGAAPSRVDRPAPVVNRPARRTAR